MSVEYLAGTTLGQYRLLQLLGSGGMGAVYRSYQSNLNREVAVKVLSNRLAKQPDYLERFSREAKTAAALEHAHIVQIYDYGMQDGISYLVMRLLTGSSLEMVLQREAGHNLPSLGETARLLDQLASALDYAHGLGIIHRDVKPSNVMFDKHGDAYLVDFGIAKLADSTTHLTESGSLVGTPGFMAPEIWRDEPLSPAADQYAMGALIYAVVTGRLPFEATTPYGFMQKHLHARPDAPQIFRPELPKAMRHVLEKALAKTPRNRYETVTDFARAFRQAIQGTERQPIGVIVDLSGKDSAPESVVALEASMTSHDIGTSQTFLSDVEHKRKAVRGNHSVRYLVLLALLTLSVAVFYVIGQANHPPSGSEGINRTFTQETVVGAAIVSLPASEILVAASSTITLTGTFTATPSVTPTVAITFTWTAPPTDTALPSATATRTPVPTDTPTFTTTPSRTATSAPTSTPVIVATPGTTILSGVLTTNSLAQMHTFVAQAGDVVSVTLNSDAFDTYLQLKDPSNGVVGFNDDCGSIRRSCIREEMLNEGGEYTVVVDSLDGRSTGAYTLEISIRRAVAPTPSFTTTPSPVSTAATMPIQTQVPATGLCADLLSPYVIITSNAGTVNLRSGPGTNNALVGLARTNECLEITGRNQDNSWLLVRLPSGRTGWLSAELGDIVGELAAVPVVNP